MLSSDIANWISKRCNDNDSDLSSNQTFEEKQNFICRLISNKKSKKGFTSPVRMQKRNKAKTSTFVNMKSRILSAERTGRGNGTLSPLSTQSKEDHCSTAQKSQLLSSTVERKTLDMKQYLNFDHKKFRMNKQNDLGKPVAKDATVKRKLRVFSQEPRIKTTIANKLIARFQKIRKNIPPTTKASSKSRVNRFTKSRFAVVPPIGEKEQKTLAGYLNGYNTSKTIGRIQSRLDNQRQRPSRRANMNKNGLVRMSNVTFMSDQQIPQFLSPKRLDGQSHYRSFLSPS
ncbi:unnamed protein product [Moneuplotes crassus]|uniref:Uncharacterized protein n=1 Tax=Euplotes crassus TaxID=5936 RepID=A0AAD1UE60_EUPCR|nr:unnamed protein product [Moneuplotes crassus]